MRHRPLCLGLFLVLLSSAIAWGQDSAGRPSDDKPACSFLCYFFERPAAAAPSSPGQTAASDAPAATAAVVPPEKPAQPVAKRVVRTPAKAAAVARSPATTDLLIIGQNGIDKVEDLNGKPVGVAGGAAQMLAHRIFGARGIAVQEYPLDRIDALDGLESGDLAAIVLVAPRPSAAVRALGSTLHLLPATAPEGMPGVSPTEIAPGAYPALTRGMAVSSVKIDSRKLGVREARLASDR